MKIEGIYIQMNKVGTKLLILVLHFNSIIKYEHDQQNVHQQYNCNFDHCTCIYVLSHKRHAINCTGIDKISFLFACFEH
jgi:hypothetical protein